MQTQDHHIITLPASPILSSFPELATESEDDDDQQEQFDRISGILSTLIQEANEAVNNDSSSLKTIPLVRKHSSSQDTQVSQRKKKTTYLHGSTSSSSSPRPVSYPSPITSNSTRRSITPSNLKRRSSPVLSSVSTAAQDSPVMTVEASVSLSRLQNAKKKSKTPLIKRRPSSSIIIPEPLVMEPSVSRMKKSKTPISLKRRSYPTNQDVITIEPSSSPLSRTTSAAAAPGMRRSISSAQKALTVATTGRRGTTDPSLLLESFKRLDSSMAEIDSLSRDLATHSTLGGGGGGSSGYDPSIMIEPLTPPPTPPCPKQKTYKVVTTDTAASNDKLIIPSSRPLTFDARLSTLLLLPLLHFPHALISMAFDSFTSENSNSASSSFSSMLLWACIFAVTNLVVDKAMVITTKRKALRWLNNSTSSIPSFEKRAQFISTNTTPISCLQQGSARCMHGHQSFEKTHPHIKRRNSI